MTDVPDEVGVGMLLAYGVGMMTSPFVTEWIPSGTLLVGAGAIMLGLAYEQYQRYYMVQTDD